MPRSENVSGRQRSKRKGMGYGTIRLLVYAKMISSTYRTEQRSPRRDLVYAESYKGGRTEKGLIHIHRSGSHTERICSYHKTQGGNNHRYRHCMFQPCYLHSWKYYEISNEEYDTVTRIPGSRVHLNVECHLQRKYAKELRHLKHTFLYLDQDLNDVSQDGRVFEASVRVDRETTEAVPV